MRVTRVLLGQHQAPTLVRIGIAGDEEPTARSWAGELVGTANRASANRSPACSRTAGSEAHFPSQVVITSWTYTACASDKRASIKTAVLSSGKPAGHTSHSTPPRATRSKNRRIRMGGMSLAPTKTVASATTNTMVTIRSGPCSRTTTAYSAQGNPSAHKTAPTTSRWRRKYGYSTTRFTSSTELNGGSGRRRSKGTCGAGRLTNSI